MARVGLKAEPVALSAESVDKLIARGSGDAALLYLYLLRCGGEYSPHSAAAALHWDAVRVSDAFAHLCELGLAEDDAPPAQQVAPKPENCPNYTSDDVTAELNAEGSAFPALLAETERRLGRTCSVAELRILLELYDHLAMPAEVLVLLISWQIRQTEEKYGPGRRPRLSVIKAEAYRWKENGIDTLESAEAWLKHQDYLRSREGELLQAVGVIGRKAVDSERRFLHQWAEWGFPPESVRAAYERTMLNTGSMKWAYCNGILRRWHGKNVHTLQEIEALESSTRSATGRSTGKTTRNGNTRGKVSVPENARKNAERMRRELEQEESGDGS